MTTPEPLSTATRLLREAVDDPGDVVAIPAGRDAAIARIAEALQARAKARVRKRRLTALALAAGVALVVGGLAVATRDRAARDGATAAGASSATGGKAAIHAQDLGRLVDPSGAVTAVREGHGEAVDAGGRVATGIELRTASAEAGLDFDTGTHVTLGSSSRLRLVEQSHRKRFALESGSFFAKVAKLTVDERFVVSTPDAEVEVRGTAFRVTIVPSDPTCGGGTPTRLEVSEGVVVLRHAGAEVSVAAGQRWPTCEAHATTVTPRALPPAATSTSKPSAPETTAATAVAVGSRNATTSPAPEASSRLAEQNDLFDEAMRLKQRGDAGGAVAKLDQLLGKYPSGPLAESAEVERMRVLGTMDRGRASTAAGAYLRRYPRGYARVEAAALHPGTP